jgi:predicted membrane protein
MAMGAGDASVDMTGNWGQNLDANIRGGVGKLTLHLPRDVGVRIQAEGGIGKIDAVSLKQEGNVYVNDALGRSEVTLHISIRGGVGQVILRGDGR